MFPKVSVIVPVYNVEKYLEKCLDSAVSQTLSVSELEVICIDDGCTDSSPEILAVYAARYENLHVIHQENGGLSAARNAGLAAARGEYILFLDSDDMLAGPEVAEKLYTQATADKLDILFFEARMSYETEGMRLADTMYSPDFYSRSHTYPDILHGQILYCLLRANHEYSPSACLQILRRDFLLENGLTFPSGIYHEDEVFTLEALSLAERTTCCPFCGYERLLRSNSIMTQQSKVRSIQGYCTGAHLLTEFAAERLGGADQDFMKLYFALVRDLGDRSLRFYQNLSQAERHSLVLSARAARHLHAAQSRARRRAFRLSVKRVAPTWLWNLLKRRK